MDPAASPPQPRRFGSLRVFSLSFGATLLLFGLLGGVFWAGMQVERRRSGLDVYPRYREVYALLQSRGLNPLPPAAVIDYGLIRGLLGAYNDPYTVFVEPVQHELEAQQFAGSFGGIGVQLERSPAGVWVMHPLPDSPAAAAGIEDGDHLLRAADLTLTAATASESIQAALRGPVGEAVTVTFARPPDLAPQTAAIRRAEIALPSVFGRLALQDATVGIVQVRLVSDTSASETLRAVRDLQARGATRFIFDLRDNPGGVVDGGVDVARLFLRAGAVLEERARDRVPRTWQVERPGPLVDLPLVVLINHGSASAAEIIAGALQAQGRAQLIGSPSYGKDTVQLVFQLADGSSLHVTAAHWSIPGLTGSLAGVGLQPDLLVERPADAPAEADPQLDAAVAAVSALPLTP